MPRVIEKTLYQFDELSDAAKEAARNWFREGIESEELTNYDDWETIAEILGVTFARKSVQLMGGGTRSDPEIWWGLSYSQGDGASFAGSYAYAAKSRARIRQHAPLDPKLHKIADDLYAVQKANGYRLQARVTAGYGSYAHSGMMDIDVEKNSHSFEVSVADEKAITSSLRAFADWIYEQLRAQDEYLNSEESVDESIRANEYEFDADGSRSRDA